MLDLLRHLAARGHGIGLHGSYDTYRNPSLLTAERQRLQDACEAAGLRTEVMANRQHFLRWRAEETPDHLEQAGFETDASGGFSDLAGFRFGTSREFPMWSWRERRGLSLRQRPLVMMEGSVHQHMGLGPGSEALTVMLGLRERSRAFGGNFEMLWHNSNLQSEPERKQFLALLEESR